MLRDFRLVNSRYARERGKWTSIDHKLVSQIDQIFGKSFFNGDILWAEYKQNTGKPSLPLESIDSLNSITLRGILRIQPNSYFNQYGPANVQNRIYVLEGLCLMAIHRLISFLSGTLTCVSSSVQLW